VLILTPIAQWGQSHGTSSGLFPREGKGSWNSLLGNWRTNMAWKIKEKKEEVRIYKSVYQKKNLLIKNLKSKNVKRILKKSLSEISLGDF